MNNYTTPEEAKTEQEYNEAIENERAHKEHHRLMRLYYHGTSDSQKRYAAARLVNEYGEGDYTQYDAGEPPKGAEDYR